MPDQNLLDENEELKHKLQQKDANLRLMMDFSTLSTEAKDVKYFASRSLELIARTNGWLIGQYWVADMETDAIVCAEPWFSAMSAPEFRAASIDRRLTIGVGLPGKVWSNASAHCIENVQEDPPLTFRRSAAAKKAGLTGAFAFPIKNGPFVNGVFEFFSRSKLSIDASEQSFYEKLGSFIGTFIAERSAEQSAREQEAIYKFVLDRAYSGFVGIDHNGSVNVWNTPAEELLGWSKEETLGQQIADFLVPVRYRDSHIQGMFRYNATGTTKVSNRVLRLPALKKNGEELIVDMYIFPINVGNTHSFGAYIADANPVPKTADIVLP